MDYVFHQTKQTLGAAPYNTSPFPQKEESLFELHAFQCINLASNIFDYIFVKII